MTTPDDAPSTPSADRNAARTGAAHHPSGGQRGTRGLLGIAVAATALCLLMVLGYNMLVSRVLHQPAPDARSATALQAPAAVAHLSSLPASAIPATPQAAADDDSAPLAPGPVSTAPQSAAAKATSADAAAFAPPDARQIPDTPMGAVIRQGEQIFLQTGTQARAFVGNNLSCANCHLDAGRLPHSAPLWGAYPLYPAYRSKTRHVDTFAERLRGCFAYSMNGKAPDPGDEVLVALEAYAFWMAQGAPVGEKLPGAGYGKLPAPAQAPDYVRGQTVFTAQCALCHGADGQGQRSGEVQVFPPLWGARSYNWGAGMHQVDKAAAFIQANMPLGRGGSLSAQNAWDVSTYINSQERPQDPRFTQDVATTRAQFHDSPYSLYGTTVNGKLLGDER